MTSRFIVQPDEHADELGNLKTTGMYEVREVFENGDSEVVHCCMFEGQALSMALSLSTLHSLHSSS